MDVKVILANGSIWHNQRAYLIGDVITGLDDRIAQRMIESRQVEIALSNAVVPVDNVPVVEQVIKTETVPVVTHEFSSEATEPRMEAVPVAAPVAVELPDKYVADVDGELSVEDSVTGIIGDINEKVKPGRKPK